MWCPRIALLSILGLAAACGGSPRTSPSRATRPPRSEPARARNGDSATERTARSATLRRRGDWKLTSEKVREVAPLVRRAAREHGVSQDLLFGIIWVESRFDRRAVSPVGARGLMQLMPRTADYLAERIDWRGSHDSFDPKFNIAAGSWYISRLIDRFGDVELALAAYNAGPAKVKRWLRGDGLPSVSIEYYTMVQTARGFFRDGSGGEVPTDDELDRLGLQILIAGLTDRQFGLERVDDPDPLR